MAEARRCPRCGAELAADAPEGLCPQCLLQAGMGSQTGSAGREPAFATQSYAGGERVVSPSSHAGGFVPAEPSELAQHFPQLEILELLGQGGMGAVYKARQTALDRFVALKVLPPETAQDPAFAVRFTREARALAKLSHPHIVAVHDFGQAVGLYYFIMEYVEGVDLRQAQRAGRLEPRQALAIVPQICEALQYAHDEGLVHRDIKPENILLDKKGRVKIADFGLAKLLGRPAAAFTLTGPQQVMGTPHYMAPEQMEHPQQVDHRADIYSLGVVLYEMLTGELPLGRFAPPSQKVQVDVRLDEVVLRALEKEPARRYQHASDVKSDLETIASQPPTVPPQPRGTLDDVFRFLMTPNPQFIRWVAIPALLWMLVCIIALVVFQTAFARRVGSVERTILGVYFAGLILIPVVCFGLWMNWRVRAREAKEVAEPKAPPTWDRRFARVLLLVVIIAAAFAAKKLLLPDISEALWTTLFLISITAFLVDVLRHRGQRKGLQAFFLLLAGVIATLPYLILTPEPLLKGLYDFTGSAAGKDDAAAARVIMLLVAAWLVTVMVQTWRKLRAGEPEPAGRGSGRAAGSAQSSAGALPSRAADAADQGPPAANHTDVVTATAGPAATERPGPVGTGSWRALHYTTACATLFCALGAGATLLPWAYVERFQTSIIAERGGFETGPGPGTLPSPSPWYNAYLTWHGIPIVSLFVALGLLLAISGFVEPIPAWQPVALILAGAGVILLAATFPSAAGPAYMQKLLSTRPHGVTASATTTTAIGFYVTLAISFGLLMLGFLQVRELRLRTAPAAENSLFEEKRR